MLPKFRPVMLAGEAPARPLIRAVRPSAPPPPPSPPRGRRLRAVAPERRDPYGEEQPTELRKTPDSMPDLEPETRARTPLPGYQNDPLGAPFDSLPSLEVRRPFDSFEAEFAERDPETQVAAAAAHRRKREGSGPRMRPADDGPETFRREPYPDPYTDPYARNPEPQRAHREPSYAPEPSYDAEPSYAPAPAPSYVDPYQYEARDPYEPPAPKKRRRDPISQERLRDEGRERIPADTRHERRDTPAPQPRRRESAAPEPAPARSVAPPPEAPAPPQRAPTAMIAAAPPAQVERAPRDFSQMNAVRPISPAQPMRQPTPLAPMMPAHHPGPLGYPQHHGAAVQHPQQPQYAPVPRGSAMSTMAAPSTMSQQLDAQGAASSSGRAGWFSLGMVAGIAFAFFCLADATSGFIGGQSRFVRMFRSDDAPMQQSPADQGTAAAPAAFPAPVAQAPTAPAPAAAPPPVTPAVAVAPQPAAPQPVAPTAIAPPPAAPQPVYAPPPVAQAPAPAPTYAPVYAPAAAAPPAAAPVAPAPPATGAVAAAAPPRPAPRSRPAPRYRPPPRKPAPPAAAPVAEGPRPLPTGPKPTADEAKPAADLGGDLLSAGL